VADFDRQALESLLLGRDFGRSVRQSAVAGGLFLAVLLVHLPPRLVGPLSLPFGLFLPALAALSLAVATVGGYRNDGLIVCVALAGGPGFGFFLPLGLFELTVPSSSMGSALLMGAVFAVAFGVGGFVLGAGARRVARRVRGGSA
jgi:hypothetical protein